jgi:anti-sigma factor RsiW
MQGDKNVGGLWCHDVLERLEDAVSGTLADDEKAMVTAHVTGCTQCEKFGARYAAMIDVLKREGVTRDLVSDDGGLRADRLLAHIWRAT